MMMIAFIITLVKNHVVIAFGTLSSFLTQLHIVSGVVFVIWHLQGMKTENIDVDLAFLKLKTFMSI